MTGKNGQHNGIEDSVRQLDQRMSAMTQAIDARFRVQDLAILRLSDQIDDLHVKVDSVLSQMKSD